MRESKKPQSLFTIQGMSSVTILYPGPTLYTIYHLPVAPQLETKLSTHESLVGTFQIQTITVVTINLEPGYMQGFWIGLAADVTQQWQCLCNNSSLLHSTTSE